MRVVGLLTVKGRGEVKHRESPGSISEVAISAFFDRQFSMLCMINNKFKTKEIKI